MSETPAWLRGAIGGASYGFVVATLSHPLDTVKTVLQVRGGAVRLRELYRGFVPAAAGSMLFRTAPFVGYEAVTSLLREQQLLQSSPLAAAFVAGAAGGVLRGVLETPAEAIKVRLQVYRQWELRMLMRGVHSTCTRNAAVIGLYWLLFEASAPAREPLPPVLQNFLAGGACSVAAWAAIYPLDTAKSHIQASSGPTASVRQQLVRIYQQSGVGGLYRGLGAGLARAFVANGAGLAAYGIVTSLVAGRHVAIGQRSQERTPPPVPECRADESGT
jgi:solute carrier family 25 carnitine/acylcarnitine transporter 20/29